MANLEDLQPGTRVRVTSRGGAAGTVYGPPSMNNTVTPPRPMVSIRFDGAGYGLNYPEDVEIVTCECGQPATEVCYRRGSSEEAWFCGSRKHRAEIQGLAARGWLSQAAAIAASPTGVAIRRRLQATR